MEGAFAWHPTGADWFDAVVRAIESAEATVDLEFYIWSPGRLAGRLHGALARAAARGCRVRLLLDAFGSELAGPAAAIVRQAGIEVSWFNPRRWARLSFRNHRKLVVVDRSHALFGGCNVADEYDGDGVQAGWRDLGVCTRVPACVIALAQSFDRMWEMAPFNRLPMAETMPEASRGDGWELFVAGAGRGGRRYRRCLHRDLAAASQIDVLAAYFVPTTRVRGLLCRAARRGRVRIIVPALGDVAIAHHASAHVLNRLLPSLVEVHQYLPAMLHAKLVITDDAVYVGSANFDPRSLRINFDLMLRIQDPQIAAQARAIVDEIQRHSSPYACLNPAPLTRLRQYAAYAAIAWLDPYIARRKLRMLS
jgi:cardiolipin synthase